MREDGLSGEERSALEGRLGADHDRFLNTASVRDVAEATGLTEIEVMAHLRQIRAEAGFRPETPGHAPALPYIAGAALLTAAGVTWWRLQTMNVDPSMPKTPPVATTTVTRYGMREPVTTSPLTLLTVQSGVGKPPPGFRVEAIGQRADKLGDGETGEVHALPYREVLSGLVASGEAMVEEVYSAEGRDAAPPGTQYHGMDGGVFSPRMGQVRLAMFGWAGNGVAWIPVPLTDEGKRRIRETAVTLLADVKREQDEALRAVDYREGIVMPPPGFIVRFAGRRLDLQKGPRISFSDIPKAALVRRLEAVLLNATYRDLRPPLGAWTGNAEQDAKIPVPAMSRFQIIGPKGELSVDVPTRLGDEEATKRAIRALAERAATLETLETLGDHQS